MDDKGYDEDDFKKPVRVNLPVVNDLPPEGVFDTDFCNRYEKGGEDGKTMMLIPGVASADQFHEQMAADDDASSDTASTDTSADNDNTAGDPLPTYAYNVNGELMSEVEKDMSQPVSGLALPLRYLAQCNTDSVQHQITPERLRELHSLEMDPDSRTGSILLALQNRKAQLEKLDTKNLHSLASYVGKVFPKGKQPQLNDLINFIDAVVSTEHIDRGLLVKEWLKGNRVSCINRTPSGANAGGGILTDRGESFVHDKASLSRDVATGVLARSIDVDIYNLHPAHAKRVDEIIAENKPPFSIFRDKFIAMPGCLDYSRAIVVASVKEAPTGIEAIPAHVTEYLNKVLTETDHANPDPLVVDIACGRTSHPIPVSGNTGNDEEKPQPTNVLADEPATSQTVEPDATECHPDAQPLDDESQVDPVDAAYQEKLADLHEARTNIPSRVLADPGKQLAAARGEYVEGVSDPNEPNWLHENYSTNSNDGEKQEVETAGNTIPEDAADNESDTGSNTAGETSNPVKSGCIAVPDDMQPGIYYDIPNEAYHAGPGVSKSQLDDIADTPAIYLWRKNAPVDAEKTKSLDTGTAFHCRVLEPEEFSKRFIIAPEFNRRTSAGKEEEKTFLEECARTGRTVLTAEEGRKIELMYQSVMALPLGQWLVESAGYAESSVYWQDPETGILCRCRPDKIIPEFHWIMDVKTTADIQRFRTAYYDYRYHVQDAFYSDGYRAQFGEIPTFVFLVASTTAECGRYPVEIFMMDEDAKLAGQREYRRNLQTLAECLNNDEWPAIKTLSLPRWAKENANA
ncbi:PD-(D/E)XK nuclease-like domain-containing protein [Salmonella enterica]|uniref:PD-(D/E)XK nuclease-like domain-containing protein n=1 Tax=Salmonella enterica TaxID=28901 RepID=UPI0038573FEF